MFQIFLPFLPTSSFTMLKLQNPWIDELTVLQERRARNFKVLKW